MSAGELQERNSSLSELGGAGTVQLRTPRGTRAHIYFPQVFRSEPVGAPAAGGHHEPLVVLVVVSIPHRDRVVPPRDSAPLKELREDRQTRTSVESTCGSRAWPVVGIFSKGEHARCQIGFTRQGKAATRQGSRVAAGLGITRKNGERIPLDVQAGDKHRSLSPLSKTEHGRQRPLPVQLRTLWRCAPEYLAEPWESIPLTPRRSLRGFTG